jgi:xanthine dehydrogenase YagR molybdenum-binding subunit
MMEPHASIAAWKGDKLTVWTSNQMIAWGAGDVAKTLGMKKEDVRLVSPFIGGGFGGKLFVRADAILAALGARAAGRPVKVALLAPADVQQHHAPAGHHPAYPPGRHPDGKITAIGHESWSGDLPGGGLETAVQQTRLLYAGENRMTKMRLATLDLPEGNAMRAPGEAPGLMALEIAIDEMAEKLNLDPVEFRVLNDTQVDPEKPGRPFSQRKLVECLRTGADKFGWAKRSARPGQVRDGRWLVGMGVAAAFRNNLTMKSAAACGESSGQIVVETDMTDIGTGSYTIIAQTAAEMMGVPLHRVECQARRLRLPGLGRLRRPVGRQQLHGGRLRRLREAARGGGDQARPRPATAEFSDGRVKLGNQSLPLAQAAAGGPVVAEDFMEYGNLAKTHQQSTFGGHFVEVGVDSFTAEIRMRRMLAVCAAGRILNPSRPVAR